MRVSVVIPSRKRASELDHCLEALSKQTIKPFEILVVQNDKKDEYQALKEKWNNLPVFFYLERKIGKSHARNLGLAKAKGDIISFLDDDCEPPPNWIDSILTIFNRTNADVVLGCSHERNNSLLVQAYICQYDNFFLERKIDKKDGKVLCGGALNTRNFAVKKAFITKKKVKFDARYNTYGFAEDTDFGKQLELAGARMFFSRKVWVWHKESGKFSLLLKKKYINGKAIATLRLKGIFNEGKTRKHINFFLTQLVRVLSRYTLKEQCFFIAFFFPIVVSYKTGVLVKYLSWLFFERSLNHSVSKK